MRLPRRATILSLAGAAGLGASGRPLSQPVTTRGWPSRPIRIVVTFAPGGSTDLVARLMAQGLQERLGQPVVVENRAGAGGTTATGQVARAEPDGNTLVFSTSTVMAIGPALYRSVQYDPMRDFAHVALLCTNHLVFVANLRFAGRNLGDLVRLSQAAQGGLDMASSGAGSLNHMLIVHFANAAGARLNHVAYRGAGPAMAAVIGGDVPLMSDSLPSASAHIRQGAVRALGIPGDRRSEQFPEVPTFREQGFDIVSLGWFGLAAPAGTPPDIVERLNREVRNVMGTPQVQTRLAEFDARPGDMPVDAFTELVRADYERWGPMVRASGASAE